MIKSIQKIIKIGTCGGVTISAKEIERPNISTFLRYQIGYDCTQFSTKVQEG